MQERVTDPDRLILNWLMEVEPYDRMKVGHHVIQYNRRGFSNPELYVVLRVRSDDMRVMLKPTFVGWFCVRDTELSDPEMYDFCCHRDGKWLYRAKHDRLPES